MKDIVNPPGTSRTHIVIRVAEVTYLLRDSTCWNHSPLEQMDRQIRSAGLEKILSTLLDNPQWMQAHLPVSDGGLGSLNYRPTPILMLANSAYVASAASTVVETIMGVEEWSDLYKEEMMESRRETLPTVMELILIQERLWNRSTIDCDKARVWNGCKDPRLARPDFKR